MCAFDSLNTAIVLRELEVLRAFSGAGRPTAPADSPVGPTWAPKSHRWDSGRWIFESLRDPDAFCDHSLSVGTYPRLA